MSEHGKPRWRQGGGPPFPFLPDCELTPEQRAVLDQVQDMMIPLYNWLNRLPKEAMSHRDWREGVKESGAEGVRELIKVKVQSAPTELATVSVKKLAKNAAGNEVEYGNAFNAGFWNAATGTAQTDDDPYIHPTPAAGDVLYAWVFYENTVDEEVYLIPKGAQVSEEKANCPLTVGAEHVTLAIDSSGRVRMKDIGAERYSWAIIYLQWEYPWQAGGGKLQYQLGILSIDDVGRVVSDFDPTGIWTDVPDGAAP